VAGRPVDWSPIAESDPTPGDPAAVRAEAKRLSNIAETLSRQVKKLRQLGDDDNIKGKYAKSLKEESDELAGRFEKTKGRYEKVSGHLNTWADELEHAQGLAKKARDKAQADEKNEDTVKEAKKDLFKATSHYHGHAMTARRNILDAIDDAVEDSTWDNLVGWAKEHAEGFKLFLDILSWIGTALAIAAIFIPGLNILVIGIGIAVVLGRMLLVAAGKATWMDVAFDAFGLLTMGLGRGAMIGLKAASKSTRAASTVQRVTKLKDGLAATKSLRNQLANRLAGATDDADRAAQGHRRTRRQGGRRDAAAQQVVDSGAPRRQRARGAAEGHQHEQAALRRGDLARHKGGRGRRLRCRHGLRLRRYGRRLGRQAAG
jgi:membrane protein implicated in regulation of membrane protease activity